MTAAAREFDALDPSTSWHPAFLSMLPSIQNQIGYSFRRLHGDRRDEATQAALADATDAAFAALAVQGRAEVARPTSLARYAVRHVRAGRKAGTKQNKRDLLWEHGRAERGVKVESLEQFNTRDRTWRHVLVEDKRHGPAEVAATRIDVEAWLARLSDHQREIAAVLATGETTKATARMFGLSMARISGLRSKLKQSWAEFQGEGVRGVAA